MGHSLQTRLACIFVIALGPTPGHAETLADALEAAYAGNPQLQGNRDLTAAADELVVQAKAAYGPNLSLGVSHQFTAARIRGTVLPSHDNGFASTVELSLSQPLFTSGRLSAGIDAAEATSLATRESLRALSQQLLTDVVTAYIALRRDTALYAIAVENYNILLQQNEVIAARFRLRDATEPDMEQTTNRLELAAGRVIEARSTVEVSAAKYRHIVGHYPDRLEPPPSLPALSTLETLYVDAERYNPSLASAQFVEQASRARVRAAKAQTGPQVSAFSSLARSPISEFENTYRQESVAVGISLSMQLYSGGAQTSAVREAIARNLADQQFVEEARRTMRESLAANWSLLRSADTALPRYAAAVDAAEKAVEGVKRQETAGIRTLRDVLDVTNDLLNARIAAAQAEAEIYLRHMALLRDAGLLSADMMTGLPDYDPDSRKAGISRYAGLPLRWVFEPVDRTFQFPANQHADIQVENSPQFPWGDNQTDPLQPIAKGDPGTP